MQESNDSVLSDSDRASLSQAEQEAIIQAYNDVLLEFAACSGEAPDDEALDVIRKHFKKTIKKGMMTSGVEIWAEPYKSFGLKYVCKIAKRHKKSCDADLDDFADATIKKARKACEQVVASPQIGLLCP
jgi:hypothetical protein